MGGDTFELTSLIFRKSCVHTFKAMHIPGAKINLLICKVKPQH